MFTFREHLFVIYWSLVQRWISWDVMCPDCGRSVSPNKECPRCRGSGRVPFWMVVASIPIGQRIARCRLRRGIRVETLTARSGIESTEWLAFENGLLPPREMLALERRVAAGCSGPDADAEAERDLATFRARWGQAWAEVGKDIPTIQRIALSGEIRPDDGPLIRRVCALVLGEWHQRAAQTTTP